MYIQICSGVRGLFDGISGTWMRQMSYSMCRFWAYDESKKILGAGKDAPAWKLAAAGSMGVYLYLERLYTGVLIYRPLAGGIAGLVGNPGGRSMSAFQEIRWIVTLFHQRSSWSVYKEISRNPQRRGLIIRTASMPYFG